MHSKPKLGTVNKKIYRVLNSLKLPIVLVGLDHKLKIITLFAEKRFGISRKNVGKSIFKVNFPIKKDKLKVYLQRAVKENKSSRILVKSDNDFWYSLRISPFKAKNRKTAGVVMVFVGVDKLKRNLQGSLKSETKTKKKEKYFRALIEQSNDVIALRDENAKILYASPSNKRLFGYKKNEFVGRNWYEFVHTDDHLVAKEWFDRVKKIPTGPIIVTYRFRHKDGSWRWIEGSLTNLLGDPNVSAIVVNFRDVTDRVDLEKLKDEFASISSHELRTPLANIKWKLESIVDGDFGEPIKPLKKELSKLQIENQKLINLVNRLLDVSRVQGKALSKKSQVVVVRELIENMLENFRKQIETKNVKVSVNILDGIQYKGDPDIFSSVITNLLENAIKYNKVGGQVVVYVRDRGRLLELEIVDTGIGISDADRKNIFKKFYRTREAAKVMSGVGLGLYSTKLHVAQLGGKIDFKSRPGLGSKFKVILPKN